MNRPLIPPGPDAGATRIFLAGLGLGTIALVLGFAGAYLDQRWLMAVGWGLGVIGWAIAMVAIVSAWVRRGIRPSSKASMERCRASIRSRGTRDETHVTSSEDEGMAKRIAELGDLVGEQVSGVAFVRDYVEFHFDGPILRSISNPSATVEDVEYWFPDEGSRDALCRVIGSTVRAVNLVEDQACELTTSNGCRIKIPLDVGSLKEEGESMHFIPDENKGMRVCVLGSVRDESLSSTTSRSARCLDCST